MISKVVNNVTYYCPRPKYKLSTLDASLSQRGISLASSVLLGHPPADVFTDEEGRTWISDIPTPDLILNKIKTEPNWIAEIYKTRDESFISIKQNLQTEIKNLQDHSDDLDILICTFQELSEIQTIFLSFVYLPLVDEILVNNLSDLVSNFLDKRQSQQYIFSLLQPPTYFANILESGILINETKVLNIPPTEELFPICGNINLDYSPVDMDSKILAHFPRLAIDYSLADVLEFSLLRSLVPIFFQIGQEDLFVGKSIIIALSHCVYKISKILVEKQWLNDEKQILNFRQEEIVEISQKIEK